MKIIKVKKEKVQKTEKKKIMKEKKFIKEKAGVDKKGKGAFKCNLFSLLITLSLIPLILSIVILSSISVLVTKGNLEQAAKDTLFVVANNLASHCKENEINAINVTDYYYYLDSLKEQNIEMAIILEGAPCTTSIKNENDYRIREINLKKDVLAERTQITDGYYEENVLIEGAEYYTCCMPIEVNGEITGIAFAGQKEEFVTGAIGDIVAIFIAFAVLLVIAFAVVSLLFSRGLSKAFKDVSKNVNALANGDLSKQKESKSAVKEMNTLLVETKQMQENLAGTIGKVKEVSGELVVNVAEVTQLSESSAGKAKAITTAMDELSGSSTAMAENVQDINFQMMEIGNCVNDISDNVEHLNNSTKVILQSNDEAKVSMDTIMHNSIKSVEAVNDITEQIKQTNDAIGEIDRAVELILSISQQTNLLSLNASIEAARAGEAGRGFAVVAEEIRRLSEQSAEGAEMIKNIAGTIVDKSGKSVQLAKGVHDLIALEQKNVSETQRRYEELSNEISQSVTEIESIAEKTDYLNSYKENVIENVQSLSAISQQNAASSQQVTANILEIISEVQTVNVHCGSMNLMAQNLEEAVSYFQN